MADINQKISDDASKDAAEFNSEAKNHCIIPALEEINGERTRLRLTQAQFDEYLKQVSTGLTDVTGVISDSSHGDEHSLMLHPPGNTLCFYKVVFDSSGKAKIRYTQPLNGKLDISYLSSDNK